MKTCVYPGSFDPITLGHIDIINRASKTFDKVIVAVGVNSSKKYTFTETKRVEMIKKSISLPNVVVMTFDGLLADFAYDQTASIIIKGVRNNQDFDYERLLHEITITQQAGIDTHILVADQKLSHVSSSAAKELCKLTGSLQNYVPYNVKQSLEFELNGQFILGVTGVIGAGKSWISDKISKFFNNNKNEVLNVDLDALAHGLYTSDVPVHVNLRENICEAFNMRTFDRKVLGEIVFNDEDSLKYLNSMVRIPILTKLRQTIQGFKGLVIINAALLVEADFLSLCNNNVVLVNINEQQQFANLKKRGLTKPQIFRRIHSQLSFDDKRKQITDAINKHNHGTLIQYNNDMKIDPNDLHIYENVIRPIIMISPTYEMLHM